MPPETKDKIISWNEWEDTYKPIRNPFNPDPDFWGNMFETFGEEYELVKAYPNNQVWTMIDGEGIYLNITSGLHWVNRLGYFVTELPWEGEVFVTNDKNS
jgi:hypothetical protein